MSIDRLLKDTEAMPLEMDILGKMSGKAHRTRVMQFSKVEAAKNLSELINAEHPFLIILIMDNREPDAKVGHYIALFLRDAGKEVVFFDSYGHALSPLLKLLKHGNKINLLIKESGKRLAMNRTKFQSESNKISTCGRWCAVRIRYSDMSNENFARFMKSSLLNGDQIVTMLTMVYASHKDGHHDSAGGREIEHLLR